MKRDSTSITFFTGRLPEMLIPTLAAFEHLWNLHPDEYHEIMMHGRLVKTPRWQQAYGCDYHYTGNTNRGAPRADILQPFLGWVREAIEPHLNGMPLNSYDASLKHRMGAHRDSRVNMIEGAPIMTISFGEERTFRLRPWKREGAPIDFAANNGTIFIMPYETNLAWTHEVLHRARDRGRRISVTLRALGDETS